MVQHHGLFQGYFYFHHVGRDRNERDRYRDHPHYQACVDFCERWDGPSFDPECDTMPLEAFEPMLHRLFATNRPGYPTDDKIAGPIRAGRGQLRAAAPGGDNQVMDAGSNVIVIMADQYRRDALGCYGSRIVRTPNIDRLAARGTRFLNAYTPSPICVSARASIATGRYVHQTRCWSSAQPYDGSIRGWAHALRDAGHTALQSASRVLQWRTTNGFSEANCRRARIDGIDFRTCWCADAALSSSASHGVSMTVGRGESSYSRFDRAAAQSALYWPRATLCICRMAQTPARRCSPSRSAVLGDPLIAPDEFFDLYPPDRVDLLLRRSGSAVWS